MGPPGRKVPTDVIVDAPGMPTATIRPGKTGGLPSPLSVSWALATLRLPRKTIPITKSTRTRRLLLDSTFIVVSPITFRLSFRVVILGQVDWQTRIGVKHQPETCFLNPIKSENLLLLKSAGSCALTGEVRYRIIGVNKQGSSSYGR